MKKRKTPLTIVPSTVEAEIVLPIADIYGKLANTIADVVGHPNVAGNTDMYLCEFVEKVVSAVTGQPLSLTAPALNSEWVRLNLPSLLIAAHNKLADEQGLPIAA